MAQVVSLCIYSGRNLSPVGTAGSGERLVASTDDVTSGGQAAPSSLSTSGSEDTGRQHTSSSHQFGQHQQPQQQRVYNKHIISFAIRCNCRHHHSNCLSSAPNICNRATTTSMLWHCYFDDGKDIWLCQLRRDSPGRRSLRRQGHSRSPILVPIKSPYANSY